MLKLIQTMALTAVIFTGSAAALAADTACPRTLDEAIGQPSVMESLGVCEVNDKTVSNTQSTRGETQGTLVAKCITRMPREGHDYDYYAVDFTVSREGCFELKLK